MSDRASETGERIAHRRLAARAALFTFACALSVTQARAQAASEAPKPPSGGESTTPATEPAPAPTAEPAPAKPDATPDDATPTNDAAKAKPEPPPSAVFVSSPMNAPPAAAAAAAPGSEEGSEAASDDGEMGSHRDHWIGSIGARVSYIPGEGLDPFDTNNGLTQFSLALGRTLYGADALSLAALVLWDAGGSEASARGDKAELFAHRLSLGGEGRYHFLRRLYAFGRFAPGAVRWDASLEDSSVGYTRSAGNWMFSLDLSAGVSFEFVGEARGKSNRPRAWLTAEGGYGWTTASEVSFVGGEDDQVPARVEPLMFDDLALRGGFFRIAANVTY